MNIDWMYDDLPPRAGLATEITQRTIDFTFRVTGGDLVRILSTGENILVLRPHKRGRGWVVKRTMGSIKRTTFGSGEAIKIAVGVIPEGMKMITITHRPL